MFKLPLSDAIKQTEGDVVVAIESTAIKVTNRGGIILNTRRHKKNLKIQFPPKNLQLY